MAKEPETKDIRICQEVRKGGRTIIGDKSAKKSAPQVEAAPVKSVDEDEDNAK